MTRGASWWRQLSGPAKFRLYTQLTLQGAMIVVVVGAAAAAHAPWAAAAIVLSGSAALLALQTQPDLAGRPIAALRRWALPVGAVFLVSVWIACTAVARLSVTESDVSAARGAGIFAALLAAVSIVPFARGKWWFVPGIGVASGVAFGESPSDAAQAAAMTTLIAGFLVATTLLTLWGLHVVEELERTKTVEARLRVAEERLRFSRDLHDVVGRGFSSIAVKSELAGALSRSGDAERATSEMDDIRILAIDSMDQMRALVRGYRNIDLDGEVAGARSLLAAAGCGLTIEGDPIAVPPRFHEVAAWVVREGTTNIVKHSTATSATVTLGNAGMSLRNNGIVAPHIIRDPGHQTGLRGLSERLAHVGAELETVSSDAEFLLEIHWEKI